MAQANSKEEEAPPSDKQVAALQAMTPESVAKAVSVRDDELETTATLTTVDAYQSNGRFTDHVRSDNFLRAFVDKASGATRFQVYQEVSYNYEWRDFRSATFSTPAGPANASLDQLSHDVVGCYANLCSYKDTVGFVVDERILRTIAAEYIPGRSPYWRFRYRAQNGIDWNDRMMPAEVAGLLEAVDAYRQQHGLPPSPAKPR